MFKRVPTIDMYQLPCGKFLLPHRGPRRGETKEQYNEAIYKHLKKNESNKQPKSLLCRKLSK